MARAEKNRQLFKQIRQRQTEGTDKYKIAFVPRNQCVGSDWADDFCFFRGFVFDNVDLGISETWDGTSVGGSIGWDDCVGLVFA